MSTLIASFVKGLQMPVTTSKLRSDIYNLLDQVLKTGQPLEVELKGRKLIIFPAEQVNKLSRLVPHDCISGEPQKLIHTDWSDEWNYDLP